MANPSTIWLDLTSFLATPIKTGIQRLGLELLKHWPDEQPCRVVAHMPDRGEGFSLLPEEVGAAIVGLAHATHGEGEAPWLAEIARLRAKAAPLPKFPDGGPLLNPELFFELPRCALYQRLQAGGERRVAHIVCDLLPWTNPEQFAFLVTELMDYIRTIRSAHDLAFISRRTRDEFNRFFRDPGGARTRAVQRQLVPPLGADGLGPRITPGAGEEAPEGPPTFLCLGTVEPRKKVGLVLDVFERLWAAGHEVGLVWAGRMGWVEDATRDTFDRLLAEQPRFTWLNAPTDAVVREAVAHATATLYLSDLEGFGLPPLESLWLGTPVVASAQLPSLGGLAPNGQVRLETLDVATVERAVLELARPGAAAAKRREIGALELPTWSDFAHAVVGWLREA